MAKLAGLFKGMGNSAQAEEPREENGATDAIANTGFTLLFVDDEEGVLRALRRIFFEENYKILTAGNADQALEIMAREAVHLVISDHRMPGMTGAQLLRILKEKWPATIRIMLTGHADIQSIMGAVNEGAVFKFITKPWNDDDLRLTVSIALQQYVLIQENIKLKELTQKQREKISKYAAVLDENKGVLTTYLLKDHEITKEGLATAQKEKREGELLGETLVRLNLTTETKIVKTLQRNLKLDLVDLKEMEISSGVVRFLPRDLCERNRILPVRLTNKQVTLAMADPSDIPKCDNISLITGLKVVPVIAKSSDILSLLQKMYKEDGEFQEFTDFEPLEEIDIIIEEDDGGINVQELLSETEVPPVIRIVNAIISEAIRYKASDIHIEPKAKSTVVRYRIDGMLHNKIRIPSDLHPATISRIKILAKMDISERRTPQDGRITVKSGTRIVDIRVSTMPTINGEKVVMRVLDKNAAIKRLDELGLLPGELTRLNLLTNKPQGIIISTGPTGSGKTTMLYSILNAMLQSTKNYQTIEDPVEYFLDEANQIYVRDKTGLTFPSILRATLRQDPDVILVGEIRDPETADVAFKAALTGHMVLSSLHTNSAVGSITRLIDMGVKPYLIASAVEGILAQRLVRKICPVCRQEETPDQVTMELLKIGPDSLGPKVMKGKGCDRCDQTGYRGRTGVFELFVMNDDFRHFISSSYKEGELLKMARAGGMKTLIEDGVAKVRTGETTLEEILRVIGAQTKFERTCETCHRLIDMIFLYCPFCGAFKQNFCIQCRIPLEDDWQMCPFCGGRKMMANEVAPARGNSLGA